MQLPAVTSRRLAGAAILACAAALAPAVAQAAAASPAAPAAVASTPRCATSDLVIWMQSDGAAAGSVFYTLMFTNLSGHACTLDGHPGVSAASLTGRRVGSPASWSPPRPRLVRLASGGTAYALLQYSDVVTGGGGPRPCHAVTAAGLRIFPPGRTASKIVPIPLTACTTSGLVYMNVQAVQRRQPPS
jgi:hypothetical protein